MNKRAIEINFHPMKINEGAFKVCRPGILARPRFGGVLCSHHP
jgi:hypothetical protein